MAGSVRGPLWRGEGRKGYDTIVCGNSTVYLLVLKKAKTEYREVSANSTDGRTGTSESFGSGNHGRPGIPNKDKKFRREKLCKNYD